MPALKQWERDYWAAQLDAQVCRDCGKAGSKAYIQPQIPRTRAALATHEPHALCIDCISRINREIDARRKATLANSPRCEVAGCRRRGTMRIGNGPDKALVCGRHFKVAERRWYSDLAGMPWLPAPVYSKADMLAIASETPTTRRLTP